tara:strand:- start:306 stop:470 length:165 start_codon:yes stop_codon:yes gene_type:complete
MKQSTKNKIMNAGDKGVPNAEKKMKDLKLGPVLPNLKKTQGPSTDVNNNEKSWA